LRKSGAEIAEEAAGRPTIAGHGAGTQSQGQSLDMGFQEWLEAGSRGCISDLGSPQRCALRDGAAIFAPNVLGASWT
jgi:hypothetical protein